MRAALLASVALLTAAPAFAQPAALGYGPGPCPFNASSCPAAAPAWNGASVTNTLGNWFAAGGINASPAVFKSGVIPAKHLAKFLATPTPTVCFVGDSTWSLADYINVADSLEQKVISALNAAYPEKTITYKDFSIGGTSLSQVGTVVGSNWPSWYTNHTLTWNSYISPAGCTSMFLNFGVNSSGNDSSILYKNFYTLVIAYAGGSPDLIFFSNAVANPAAGAPYNTPGWQIGGIGNASLLRTMKASGITFGLAGVPPIGLVDVGRVFSMAVQGFDPATQYLGWDIPPTAPVSGITTFPYTFDPSPGGDFTYSVTFTNGAGFISAGTVMKIHYADSGNVTNAAWYVSVTPNGGSNVFVQLFGGFSPVITNINAANWSSTTNTITLTQTGGRVTVSVNGVAAGNSLVPTPVATYSPLIEFNNGVGPTGGTSMTINSYAIGNRVAYQPMVSQANCYGSTGGTNSGNGINHDSSYCLNMVYQHAVDSTTWRDSSVLGPPTLLASAIAVNMNGSAPTDTAFVAAAPTPSSYLITEIRVRNCSHTTASAVGAVYTAASAGGVPLTTSAAPGPVVTADNTALVLAGSVATQDQTASTWFYHLTTAEGAATTCDMQIYGRAYQ